MANLTTRVSVIIRKLDAARQGLAELVDLQENLGTGNAGDSRMKLQTDIREFTDYLEKATWWRKK